MSDRKEVIHIGDWAYTVPYQVADEIERLQAIIEKDRRDIHTQRQSLKNQLDDIKAQHEKIERLRAALEAAHDVLANGGDLKTDTYQTRCNRALAITRDALNGE